MINVDNTLLCDFKKCQAMGIARHGLGLCGRGEKLAADIGNVFHAGLEAHFRGKGIKEVAAIFEQAHRQVVPYGEVPEKAEYLLENCLKIMKRFCQVRPVEKWPFEAVEFEQVVGAELAPGIMFWAKRDLRVRDRQTGKHSPLDHKTRHGVITDWWAQKFRMGSQLTGYCWIEQATSGELCLEAYVNAIEVKQVPGDSKKCRLHGVPYFECGVEHINMQVFTFSRTPEMIERWKGDAIGIAGQFEITSRAFPSVEYLRFAERGGAFTEGCTFCEFKKWCASDFHPDLKEELTVYAPWKPWELV